MVVKQHICYNCVSHMCAKSNTYMNSVNRTYMLKKDNICCISPRSIWKFKNKICCFLHIYVRRNVLIIAHICGHYMLVSNIFANAYMCYIQHICGDNICWFWTHICCVKYVVFWTYMVHVCTCHDCMRCISTTYFDDIAHMCAKFCTYMWRHT